MRKRQKKEERARRRAARQPSVLVQEFWNLPNMLTLGRIFLIPLFVWLTYDADPMSSLLAAAVFAVASITDVVDGYLARRWNLITVVGKFMDPLADKLIVMAALVMMVRLGRVAAWVVIVLLTKFEGRLIFGVRKELVGAAIFGVASLTDWLDGYLARRRQQITTLGQLMDPLADKLLITAALVSLVSMDLAPAWMVAVILGREFAVTVLRSVVHARGQTMPASPIGKIKMVAQVVAILLLILSPHLEEFYFLGQVALWVATIAALVSAVDYSRKANAALAAKPVPMPAAVPVPVALAPPAVVVAATEPATTPQRGRLRVNG